MSTRANHNFCLVLIFAFVVCGCTKIDSQSQDDSNSEDATQLSQNAHSHPKPVVDDESAAGDDSEEETPPVRPASEKLELADIVERVEPGVVRLDVRSEKAEGVGSGFLIDKSGIVVTNYHVIAGARAVTATFNSKQEVRVAGYLLARPEQDIALLKLERVPEGAQVVPLAATVPRKGESVYTFGSPRGLSFSVSTGTVSAVRQSDEFKQSMGIRPFEINTKLIQTDAAISPGNSGGPLVNNYGEVVGVNTISMVAGQNLNFSISATELKPLIKIGRTESLHVFRPGKLPPAEPLLEPPRITDALKERIAASLAKHSESWKQKAELQIAGLRDQIEELQDDVRGRKLLMAAVKEGGRDATTILKQTPKAESRAGWLKLTKEYLADREAEIAAIEQEIREHEELRDKGLFTPPLLQFDRLAVGNFGYLSAIGTVSQVLGRDHFIAYFGETQIHCRGFDIANLADDSRFRCSMMCIIPSTYSFVTVTGARRTIFSVMPLDPSILPSVYAEILAERESVLNARRQKKLDAWEEQIEVLKKVVDSSAVFPILETDFEPKTIAEMLQGEGLPEAPHWPRQYSYKYAQRVILRTPPAPPIVYFERSKRESSASKQRRLQRAKDFHERREVYVQYAIDSLIRELEVWTNQPDNIYNNEDRLGKDVEKLHQVAFGKYGIEPQDRVQKIPWTKRDREKIIDHLQHIAVHYGKLPENLSADALTADSDDSSVAEQIEDVKAKLDLKKKALENGSPSPVKKIILKKHIEELEQELKSLQMQEATADE